MTSEQLFEPEAEPYNISSLLNEQLLKRYNPRQQSVLRYISQNPQAPTEKDWLALAVFSGEPDLNMAKKKLSETIFGMKKKLTDDKLKIVNSSVEAGYKGSGTRVSYYLGEITTVNVQPAEIPPYPADLFDPRFVRDLDWKEDLILAGLNPSNRTLFEEEYRRLYAMWVNKKLPPATDLNRVIELAAMVTATHRPGIQNQ